MTSDLILKLLTKEKQFARKVLPHIEKDYFESIEKKTIFNMIKNYIIKYKNLPSISVLKVEITKNDKLNETMFNNINKLLDEIETDYKTEYDIEWLVDKTEEWCKDRALHNAILESVQIIEDKKPTGAIPEIVRKALQVEFDNSIGINFLEKSGIDTRWEAYQKPNIKIPTNIEALDLVFSGGVEEKSLMLLMGGCVVHDTLVTVRHKLTGEISKVKIGDLMNI